MGIVEKIITKAGQALEFALTGQTDYRVNLSEFAKTRTVDGSVQARLVLDDLQPSLKAKFGIHLRWPILLELKRPPPRDWKASFYHSEGNLGRYSLQTLGEKRAHEVLVVPGLPRPKFRAILGHELVHAYQREQKILERNRALREGMARWIEYHLLLESHPKEAKKLLNLRHFTFGKAVRVVADYETQHGTTATMKWLKYYDRGET